MRPRLSFPAGPARTTYSPPQGARWGHAGVPGYL
jgi:hypothetical protein